MKKRTLSLILAIIMLLGTVSIPVACAEDTTAGSVSETGSVSDETSAVSEETDKELTEYVNMRYGTGTNAECLIGPARPNGSVHPGPDTYPTNNYTGYYPNKPIRGFSQMHIQAGEGRFGQFLISPQVGLSVALDSHDSAVENETPTATEYSVTLSDYDIDVSLTPTENAVIYKFTYPQGTDENTEASILLDMIHHVPVYSSNGAYNKQAKDVDITIEQDENGNTILYGGANYSTHGSWRYYYFYAVIDSTSLTNKNIGVYKLGEIVNGETSIDTDTSTIVDPTYLGTGAYMTFDLDKSAETTVMMKIGISFKDVAKAKASLEAEIPAWDYDKVKNDNNTIWNDKLDVIEVSGLTEDQKEMFYSNLYDTFLQPRYRTGELAEYGDGMMLDDHVATWDTFRTLFPLLTLTNPQLVTDQIESYLVRFSDKEEGSADTVKAVKDIFTAYERSGTNQGGDNIDNVLAEAYVKGLIPEDMMDAVYELVEFEATMMRTDRRSPANAQGSLTSTYKDLGWIPGDTYATMCCNTQLEYCYNDYCLAQIAKGEGDTELYNMLMERSASWLNIWNEDAEGDKFTGWIWPKNEDGTWVEPNSNLTSATKFIGSWKPYFYEGTGYSYSFFVPHDIPTLMEKMGGEEEFIERLQVGIDKGYIDVSNQPGYIQAFLFNYTSEPWHTTDYVEKLINRYTINSTPGCEDSGASCAWYIFANIGFFPSAGQDFYWLTSPKYEQTTFNLDNGNTFTIKANNLSAANKYIQAVYLNGVQLESTTIKHADIVAGGELVYEMGSTPVDYSTTVTDSGAVAEGNYTWELRSNGVLTISGTGNGTLSFDSTITADNLSDIPWYSHRNDILKVEIAEATKITAMADYALSNLPNCTTVLLPSTLTDLSGDRIFASDTALTTLYLQGEDKVEGVINLTEMTALSDCLFEDASAGLTVTLELGDCDFAPVKWFTESTTVNFSIDGKTPAETWVLNVEAGTADTRDADYKFTIGTVDRVVGGENTVSDNEYSWTLDTESGVLTFVNTGSGYNEIAFTAGSSAFNEWVVDWRDEIEHIVIPSFDKFTIDKAENIESPFAGLENLKTVKIDATRWLLNGQAVFANCKNLTSLGTSSNFKEGKIKLAGYKLEGLWGSSVAPLFTNCYNITSVDFTDFKTYKDAGSTLQSMVLRSGTFENCTALTEVIFGDTAKINAGAFKNCTALTELTIPATITAIAAGAFEGCTALTSVELETETYTDGLMTATSFPDKDGLNVYCQTKAVKEALDALGYEKTQFIYEQYATGSETVGNSYSWSLDRETGILTFTDDKAASDWCELSFTKDATAFATWVAEWKDEIKHIVIPVFDKLSVSTDVKSPFAGLTNLETVKIDTTRWLLNSKSLFEGCTSLTSLGKSSNFEEGKVKLAGYQIDSLSNGALTIMFTGCSSITSLDFTGLKARSDGGGNTAQSIIIRSNSFEGCSALKEIIFAETASISGGAFKNCTALTNVTIPVTLTAIAAGAYEGCSALTSVTLEAESYTEGLMTATSFPDKDGLIIYCQNQSVANAVNALGYTLTKAVNLNAIASSGITMEGFSIRTEGYNGLRGIFSFDNTEIAANEANGLTLVEYGAIITSETNKNTYGTALTYNGTSFVTANTKIVKKAIWSGGSYVGKVLPDSTDSLTKFAISIIKYTGNYDTGVCMLGYSVWQDASGKLYYEYVDCSNDEYDTTSLYDVTLQMYKNGIVNGADDTDGIIWNTLVEGGAVTLTAGTDYNNSAIYYEADGSTAKSFGDTFLAVDVPCVKASVSGTTTTCTDLGSTYSLFEDGDNYVIIFRAGTSGSAPKQLPSPSGGGWGTAYQQFSNTFAPSAEKIVNAPNPVLTSTAAAKITYAVIDNGIEKIPNSAFHSNKQIQTIVYPDTLSSIGQWAFKGSSITTMFKAGDTAEVGKIDFANYTGTMDTYAMFYSAQSFTKICLPANLTELKGLAFNTAKVKRIWVSGSTEPKYDGIADLSGANISTGDSTFQHVKTLNLIMLHDDATLHETRTIHDMGSDVVTVWTKNNSAAIAAEIQNIKNGTVYTQNVDYIVGDEALASYLTTKYGS